MVCGAEADRYLEASLKEFKRLCDDAVIALNHADKRTEKLIKDYGFWCYHDDREWGIHQPSIKTDLLKRIGNLNPDVILPLDSDEVFDSTFTRKELEEWSDKYPACYFYIVNLWNSPDRQRKSLGFWNIRMFNWRPDLGLDYQKKNLHCGLGPPWAYNYGAYIPHLVKHYGLMKAEDRQKKVERYEKFDPQAKWKDRSYYEALKAETIGSEFNEADMLQRLREEYNSTGNQNKNIMNNSKDKKYVYVRREKDGKVLDIPAEHLAETLRQGFTLVGEVAITTTQEAPVEKKETFKCIFCGSEYKTPTALKAHKTKAHAS